MSESCYLLFLVPFFFMYLFFFLFFFFCVIFYISGAEVVTTKKCPPRNITVKGVVVTRYKGW